MLLPAGTDEECHRLDVSENAFHKRNNLARVIVIQGLIVGMGLLGYIPEEQTVYDYPTESTGVGIYFVASMVAAYFFSRKARPYKVAGFQINIVKTYRAYKILEEYRKDELNYQLEKAQKQIKSLSVDLRTEWGNISEKKTFKSLVMPIDHFMKNLDNRLVPAMSSKKRKDVSKILYTLSKIILFFKGEEFNEIESVNKELEKYPDVSKLEEPTSLEKIKQNKHLVSILISISIIAIGWVLSYSTQFLPEPVSTDNRMMLWAAISVPVMIWFLHTRYRRSV